jgi:1,4-dihydroxy-2-naphthoyl-CoA hydrolase
VQLSDVPNVGLDRLVGLRLSEVSPGRVSASLTVADHLSDGAGALHRGVLSAVVEACASVAGAAWFAERGQVVGVSNSTSHFAAVTGGVLDVVAEPVDRQDARQQWTVQVRDAAGTLVAQGTVWLSNIPDAARLGR